MDKIGSENTWLNRRTDEEEVLADKFALIKFGICEKILKEESA